MNDFKGLARDTSVIKTPEQMWQYAKNLILTNKYLSVTNEKGNSFMYNIPGIFIGAIVTNDDIVYFTIDGNYSCIGYCNSVDNVYVPVLRTNNPNFKFNINSPIEGVYVYNYKKELIVVFSDGINTNSSSPKLINLFKPQIALSTGKEFINPLDYKAFELFTHNELPSVKTEYQAGALDAEVVHVAIAYVSDDNTSGLYTPILDTVYPNFKGYNTVKRNVKFTLSSLSKQYSKIKLAFIIKKQAGVFAYTTAILSIIDDKVEYTLSSDEDLDIATPDEIVVASERFTKIRTITKTANQIEIGNVQQSESFNFQPYANMLKVGLRIASNESELEQYKNNPTFLPDEVYNISIVPIFTDGTKGNAFHIPGKKGITSEKAVLTDQELGVLGLNIPKLKNKGYKQFHFINTGTVNNLGVCTWGYWENEDKYPNKDYYNSSILGGDDLRGTPIRFHRFPQPNAIPAAITKTSTVKAAAELDDTLGKVPRFYLELENFDNVVPANIKALLQGYEIVFEKRTKGGTYIETSGLLYKATVGRVDEPFKIEVEEGEVSGNIIINDSLYRNFTISNFISVETVKDKIDINADIVKIYSSIKQTRPINDKNLPFQELPTDLLPVQPIIIGASEDMAVITDAKYLLKDNISSNNRFGEEKLQLTLQHLKNGDPSNDFVPLISGNETLNILNSALITLNKNIYNLENNNEFISAGIILFNKENEKLINGDVFTNNIIKKSFSAMHEHYSSFTATRIELRAYVNYYLYNMYSPLSNHYIVNGTGANKVPIASVSFSGLFYSFFYRSWRTSDVNTLNAFDYSTTVKAKEVKGYFNDYVGALAYPLTLNYISYFPYRVYKGLAIPNESLQTSNLRFFPTNSYYDMRNDRGEIIALRGFNNGLYIQQKYSLSKTTISDKLDTNGESTYLGNTELFDRLPEEIMYNDNIGYIGSNSQFACIVTKDGYITVDEEKGKIFMVSEGMNEISQQYLKNYFQDALPLGNKFTKIDLLGKKAKVDNPYNSVGFVIGVDEQNSRLLITKKIYEPKATVSELTFDGEFYKDADNKIVPFATAYYFTEVSLTYSYALDSKTWVAPHDYHPNTYFNTNKGMFGIQNTVAIDKSKIYKFNSNDVNPGNFFGTQYESYVDLIFNTRLDINKQYQSISWVSEAIEMDTERVLQFDTVDKLMVYSNHQCSGIIPISKTSLGNTRNTEGIWQMNEFRDMMISPDKKVIDEEGNLITSSLSTDKPWFNKGLFIGNFIVVRFIWDNTTKVLKHIHNVNVKSVTSNR